ncbi:DUF2484 family protein [Solirhodobacter olei]|uniref:DUF2484 family protein n=1 Tax=Solirhodobacter olei TaxID=2493082 RepID=UPI000FDB2018|nr:DUF2484 family protein [Solirhodobacter olei]
MLLALACILWVFAATGIAMLPMRRQMLPGFGLLIAAPVIIVWIGAAHGPWIAALAALTFLSVFRRPLVYLSRRALGLPSKRPDREGR